MAPRFLARLGVGRKRRDSRVYPLRGTACREDPKERPSSLLTSMPISISSGNCDDKEIDGRPADIMGVSSSQGKSGLTLTLQEPSQQGRKRKLMESLNHAVKRVMTGISRKFTPTSLTEGGSRSLSELPVLHSPLSDERTKGQGEEAEALIRPGPNLLDEAEWREIRVTERFAEEMRAWQGQPISIDADDLELSEELILETAALIALYRERAIIQGAVGEAIRENSIIPRQSNLQIPEESVPLPKGSLEKCVVLEGEEAKIEKTIPHQEPPLRDTNVGLDELLRRPPSFTEELASSSSSSIKDGVEDGIVSEEEEEGGTLGDTSSPEESASNERGQSLKLFTIDSGGLVGEEASPPAEHSGLSDSFVSCISHHSSSSLVFPSGRRGEPSEQEASLEYLELLANLFREEGKGEQQQRGEATDTDFKTAITEPVQRALSVSPMAVNGVLRWSNSCSLTDLHHSGSRSDDSRGPRRKSSRILHLIALFEGSIMDLTSEEGGDHHEGQ